MEDRAKVLGRLLGVQEELAEVRGGYGVRFCYRKLNA